ncbi:MAG: hypothetical protein NVSMB5_19920 [Candidatus Velthaea sp.]
MSVHDRPSAIELLDAVRGYLIDEVAATATDRRAIFRARIAANVIAIVQRELASASADSAAEDEALQSLGFATGSTDDRRRDLAQLIRAGAYDDAQALEPVVRYVTEHVERKLRVAKPKYLA